MGSVELNFRPSLTSYENEKQKGVDVAQSGITLGKLEIKEQQHSQRYVICFVMSAYTVLEIKGLIFAKLHQGVNGPSYGMIYKKELGVNHSTV